MDPQKEIETLLNMFNEAIEPKYNNWLRDYYAGIALGSLIDVNLIDRIKNEDSMRFYFNKLSLRSYDIAEAMLEEKIVRDYNKE